MTEKEAYLVLNLLSGIGPIKVRHLLDRFEKPSLILRASESELRQVQGIGKELAALLRCWESHADLLRELRRISEEEIHVLIREEEGYPALLRQIYDPPLVLYVKGRLTKEDERAIAMVGSRRATHYGMNMARKLSHQIAFAGWTVYSGLARGIDTAAHEGALAAGGRTVAVIGAGLGKLYPPENIPLAEKIMEQGAVISEFPVDYPPDKQSFPLRNRIVSGASHGVVVVEAPEWSGSMITAKLALEQGRHVFAVPGPADRPSSVGPHRLIQEGAKLIMSAQDLFDELPRTGGWGAQGQGMLDLDLPKQKGQRGESQTTIQSEAESSTIHEFNALETSIMNSLSSVEMTLEELMDVLDLGSHELMAALLKLEILGFVKALPGQRYVLLEKTAS